MTVEKDQILCDACMHGVTEGTSFQRVFGWPRLLGTLIRIFTVSLRAMNLGAPYKSSGTLID